MNGTVTSSGVALALVLLVGCRAPVAEPAAPRESFATVTGEPWSLPAAGERPATVLLFAGHQCPISNGYAPEVGRLHAAYAPRGVAFAVVYAEPDLTAERAARHAREFAYPCPAVLDPALTLARRFGAKVVPEAVVLDGKLRPAYVGRIDDLYFDYGKRRPAPTRADLREALDDLLANRPVRVARAAALGCDIDFAGGPAKSP